MMKLLKAAGTQKRFRKFQTTSTPSKKSWGGVLYMAAQKNYLSGGKVNQTSTMSSMSNKFQVLLPSNVKGNLTNKPNLF